MAAIARQSRGRSGAAWSVTYRRSRAGGRDGRRTFSRLGGGVRLPEAATGLVSLPGMMTGQILGGVSPVEAVKYQILVMFLIAGGTGFGAVAAVLGGVYCLTDGRHRLRLDRPVGPRRVKTAGFRPMPAPGSNPVRSVQTSRFTVLNDCNGAALCSAAKRLPCSRRHHLRLAEAPHIRDGSSKGALAWMPLPSRSRMWLSGPER